MSDDATPKKKVVRVESSPVNKADGSTAAQEPVWKPSEEAKAKATKLRIIAWIGWALAIAVEAVLIFWVLRQWAERSDTANMWLLIGGIVLTGIFASAGSVFWKKANRLDPASKKDTVRFFVQNQLGAIMSVIAFLPLIILIFMNKDMDGKQKAIAGSIGVVVAAIAVFAFGADYSPPSQEQYAEEENIMVQLTGKDEVVWVKGGAVFHVCDAVPDVNKESKDGQIYVGTVADAHAAGKDRLTQRWESEAVKYCGYSQEQVDAVKLGLTTPVNDESASNEDSASTGEAGSSDGSSSDTTNE